MNHLSESKSPYLLQHKDNPVDWYPWCDEAFEKAKTEDKPVFLSIGYATCHWCHVMAHESFEDEEVAELMNDAFVNIKVDREERPDIDNTYMTICQMLTGRGGWPLTIVMTPDKDPFFAGTYLPRESRGQQLGMMDLVPQIQQIWEEDRERINQSVKSIRDGFSKTLTLGSSAKSLPDDIVAKTRESLGRQYDSRNGGFGSHPKFPSPHNLLFLLHHGELTGDEESTEMALHTLRQMRLGGIWDHIGGGFHRYSTDEKWLLPHFEKMLYDQAMLLMAYTEGWRLSGNPLFKDTCYRTFDYLKAKMSSDEGAYYSAEDADSEGEEGKFYVWKMSEIYENLSEEDARLFCDVYNLKEEGNFRDEASGQMTGQNIPHQSQPLSKYAAEKSMSVDELAKTLERIRTQLFQTREKRVPPLLDDKILTDWNGLLMAAFASAGAVFSDSDFTDAAVGIESFIDEKLTTAAGQLLHRYREHDSGIDAMSDDYTSLIWGLIELYQSSLDPVYLEKAVYYQEKFEADFADNEYGGYFFTSENSEKLLGRQKEIYDGALPSSNSIAALNGFRLARLTGSTEFEIRSDNVFQAFSEVISDNPSGYSFAMTTKLAQQHQPREIAVTGRKHGSTLKDMLSYLTYFNRFQNSVVLKTDQTKEKLDRLSPFTRSFDIDDTPRVYICQDFSCSRPVKSLSDLKTSLA